MTKSVTIGVGLISAGWMGRLHSKAYTSLRYHFPDIDADIKLIAAADSAEISRTHARDVLGYESVTADYYDVLNNPEVDVVSICAPNFLHRELALATAAAGKPFWIEKPMGRNAQESQDITQAASTAGLVTSVGFNYRHAPAIAHARELIKSGKLGTIRNVRVALNADYSSDPLGVLSWRFLREQGGSGVWGDLVSHGIDLAQYLVGRITSVSAASDTFIKERPTPSVDAVSHFVSGANSSPKGTVENEDFAVMLTRFEGGAIGVFESSRIAVGPHCEYQIEIYGSLGTIRWDFERLNELQIATGKEGFTRVLAAPGFGEFSRFQPGSGTSMGFDDLKTIEASLFIRSVLERKQLAPSAGDGWSTAEVIDAAVESASTQAWTTVRTVDAVTTYNL